MMESNVPSSTRRLVLRLWYYGCRWATAAQKVRDLLAAGLTNDEINRTIQNSIALAEGFD
jgi:uncharacterized protein YjiS (DUF1127 family)